MQCDECPQCVTDLEKKIDELEKQVKEAYEAGQQMCECPQAANEAGSAGLALLSGKVKSLFKELDEKHHYAEADYFRTKSKFYHGRTAALGEVCSKLMVILNETT